MRLIRQPASEKPLSSSACKKSSMDEQITYRLKNQSPGSRPLSSYEITLQIQKEQTEKARLVSIDIGEGDDQNGTTTNGNVFPPAPIEQSAETGEQENVDKARQKADNDSRKSSSSSSSSSSSEDESELNKGIQIEVHNDIAVTDDVDGGEMKSEDKNYEVPEDQMTDYSKKDDVKTADDVTNDAEQSTDENNPETTQQETEAQEETDSKNLTEEEESPPPIPPSPEEEQTVDVTITPSPPPPEYEVSPTEETAPTPPPPPPDECMGSPGSEDSPPLPPVDVLPTPINEDIPSPPPPEDNATENQTMFTNEEAPSQLTPDEQQDIPAERPSHLNTRVSIQSDLPSPPSVEERETPLEGELPPPPTPEPTEEESKTIIEETMEQTSEEKRKSSSSSSSSSSSESEDEGKKPAEGVEQEQHEAETCNSGDANAEPVEEKEAPVASSVTTEVVVHVEAADHQEEKQEETQKQGNEQTDTQTQEEETQQSADGASQNNPTEEQAAEQKNEDTLQTEAAGRPKTGSAITPDTELAEVPLEEVPDQEKVATRGEPIEPPEKAKKGCCVIS